MSINRYISPIVVLALLFFSLAGFSQSVGLVLSGGGASGLAHIGVIKALEENEIPIDYITGTSMGALVGGMYSAGYSPAQMEALVSSKKFQRIANGDLENQYIYSFRQREEGSSWITVKLSKDTLWNTALPTNMISPVAMDFEMMSILAGPIASAGYNFDSLFVPFRCVASDIELKEQVIFNDGPLSVAIRASMAFPFFLRPITVDDKLLFDGGLYNNFPSDVMSNDFSPGYIIGSNVSGNTPKPDEENLILQVKNMLIAKTDYSLHGKDGIIIEPKFEAATFDFSKVSEIIETGYQETLAKIEEIKKGVTTRRPVGKVNASRQKFHSKVAPLVFDDINIEGLNKRQSTYVNRLLVTRRKPVRTVEEIKPGYFRVFGDEKIKYIFPTAKFNKETGHYGLNLKVKKEKDILVDFGGNFSSRPINTAHLGVAYNHLGRSAIRLSANSYFGRLYASIQTKARFDFPVRLPFYIEGEFTRNRWDYFKSRATFFEDVKPSFLIQNETFGAINLGFPVKSKGKLKIGLSQAVLKDEYYQTRTFLSTDTTDNTTFEPASIYAQFERSSLNNKQYATAGTSIKLSARYMSGTETTDPGSTSPSDFIYYKFHEWYQLKLSYQQYYKSQGKLRLGFLAEGVYSTQELFNNYTASILRAPAFMPTPESKTLFLESFRAYKYGAIGHQFIFTPVKNLDIRLEGYLFQPFQEIIQNEDLSTSLGPEFEKRFTMATLAAVFHAPIGQVAVSANYYHNNPDVSLVDKTPLTVLFHFGYVLFNNRALD